MSSISLSQPIEVLLEDDTLIRVNNLESYSEILDTYSTGPTIANWGSFDRNHNAESGTITFQSSSDINGDGNPPLLFVTPNSIFDQDQTLTLETFYERPDSIIDINNVNKSGAVIPSINYSGALFDTFVSSDVLRVQGTNNPLQKFPTSGKIILNNEVMSYQNKTTNTLTGVVRSQDGTSQQTHNSGDYLRTITV